MNSYKFANHEKGDTFNAIGFQLKVNSIPVNLTGAAITATFRKYFEVHVMQLGTGLSMVDAATGSFKIDEQVIDWKAGVWNMEVKFVFADGNSKTWLKGTLNIKD